MKYNYCPNCGTKYITNNSTKFECTNCKQVLYLNSKTTASTLILKGKNVLLGKRSSEPEKGKWDVIGGFIEYGENPEQAAIREAREETGLEVKIEKLLGVYTDEYGDEKIPTINLCYVVSVLSGNEQAGDDIGELKWFNANELPKDIAFKNNKEMLNTWVASLH